MSPGKRPVCLGPDADTNREPHASHRLREPLSPRLTSASARDPQHEDSRAVPWGDLGRPQGTWNSQMRVCRWGRRSAHTPAGPRARNPGGGKGPPDLPGEPGAGVGAPASFPCGDRPHLHLLAHEPGTRISSRPRDFSRTHRVNFLLFPPCGRNPSLVPEETAEGGGRPLRTAAVCPAPSPRCSGLTLEKKNKKKKNMALVTHGHTRGP